MNSRQSKFLSWINYRVRVIIQDSRQLVGTLLAFDKHMNLVLADTEEFTRYKSKKDEGGVDKERKRGLGLVLLRGENIISFSAESPPTENVDLFNDVIKNTDEGKSIPMGRGMPVPIDFNPLMGLGGPNGMMGGNVPGILPGQGGRGMIPVNSVNMNMVMGRGNIPNQNNMPQMNMNMNGLSNNMGNIPQGISGLPKMPNFNGGNNNINQGGIPNPMMNNMMRPPNMMPGMMNMPMMNQNQLNNKQPQQPQQNNTNTQQP